MEWPVLIIAAVCAVTAIVVAFMVDAHSRREREQVLASPPDRPELAGEGTPDYVTEEEVRAAKASRPVSEIPEMDEDGAVIFPYGWASGDFVTDQATKRVVLRSPVVLVAESVRHIEDLVPIIRTSRSENTGLAVAAGEIAPEVVATLAMNAMSDRLACVCVIAEDCAPLADVVGATVVPAADLRSGYVPGTVIGHCELWVSGVDRTWIVPCQPQPNSSR